MKYSVAILALAATVMAGPIEDTLKTVDTDIKALTTAVGSYTGDQKPLTDAAKKLIDDITSGVSTVKAADKLDIGPAAALATFVTGLGDDGKALRTALAGKRDEVQKAGACATVRDIATNLSTQSDALIDAVTSKVPDSLADTAKLLSAQLRDTLKGAKDDFSEANCKDSGSKPTGGSSSSAAPSGSSKPTGAASSSAAPSTPAGTPSSKPTASASGTGPVTVPTGAAAIAAPAGLFAAAVAALAL